MRVVTVKDNRVRRVCTETSELDFLAQLRVGPVVEERVGTKDHIFAARILFVAFTQYRIELNFVDTQKFRRGLTT